LFQSLPADQAKLAREAAANHVAIDHERVVTGSGIRPPQGHHDARLAVALEGAADSKHVSFMRFAHGFNLVANLMDAMRSDIAAFRIAEARPEIGEHAEARGNARTDQSVKLAGAESAAIQG